MNERVKNIAKQAGYYLYDLTETHQTRTVETDGDEWDTLEKFAELVVSDCFEKIAEVWYEQGIDAKGINLHEILAQVERKLNR